MPTSPFDFINSSKRGDKDLTGYSYFIVTNMISSSIKLLPIAQMMNGLGFSRLPDNIKASVTNEILSSNRNVYLTYPKGVKKVNDKFNNDYLIVSKYLKCSIKEAKLYVDSKLLSQKDIKKMKDLID